MAREKNMLFYREERICPDNKGILTLLSLQNDVEVLLFMRGENVLEKNFQSKLIKELKEMFEGCIVTKLDSGHIQGIPDLLVFCIITSGQLWNVKNLKVRANNQTKNTMLAL